MLEFTGSASSLPCVVSPYGLIYKIWLFNRCWCPQRNWSWQGKMLPLSMMNWQNLKVFRMIQSKNHHCWWYWEQINSWAHKLSRRWDCCNTESEGQTRLFIDWYVGLHGICFEFERHSLLHPIYPVPFLWKMLPLLIILSGTVKSIILLSDLFNIFNWI